MSAIYLQTKKRPSRSSRISWPRLIYIVHNIQTLDQPMTIVPSCTYVVPRTAHRDLSWWPHSCPVSLRRFLRARRFDPQKAHKQFSDAEAWRVRYTVDTLFATFDPVEFEAARRFYPRWTGRRDKVRLNYQLFLRLWEKGGLVYSAPLIGPQHGCPVYVYRIASLSGSLRQELSVIKPERKYQSL